MATDQVILASSDPIPGLAEHAAANEGQVMPGFVEKALAEKAAKAEAARATAPTNAPAAPSIDQIRDASSRFNALKGDPEWMKRFDRGDPTAVKEFRELTGMLSRASNADLALANVSADGHWDRGDGSEMGLRDVASVVNDLRNDLMFDEPIVAQIVRNEPISATEQRLAQLRAKQLATDTTYQTALMKGKLWARQTSKLLAYFRNAPVIQEG